MPRKKKGRWGSKSPSGQAGDCIITQRASVELKVKNKKPLTKREYYEYIRSDMWKERKRLFMKKWYNRFCYTCETSTQLQVHHLSYEHVGCEYDDELCTLCSTCHSLLHENIQSTDPSLKKKSIAFMEKCTGEPYNNKRFKKGDSFRGYSPQFAWIV